MDGKYAFRLTLGKRAAQEVERQKLSPAQNLHSNRSDVVYHIGGNRAVPHVTGTGGGLRIWKRRFEGTRDTRR